MNRTRLRSRCWADNCEVVDRNIHRANLIPTLKKTRRSAVTRRYRLLHFLRVGILARLLTVGIKLLTMRGWLSRISPLLIIVIGNLMGVAINHVGSPLFLRSAPWRTANQREKQGFVPAAALNGEQTTHAKMLLVDRAMVVGGAMTSSLR